MHRQTQKPTELDMMMIRAGWTWTRPEIEASAIGPRIRFQCALCRKTAKFLRAVAQRLEARAIRLETPAVA